MGYHLTAFYQMKEIFGSLYKCSFLKASWAVFLAFCAAVVGTENYELIAYLGALIIIDLITGIGASVMEGHPIESRKVFKTATKSVVYILFITASHVTTHLVPASTFIVTGVVAFLALTEFFSLIENIAKMGYKTPKKLLNQKNPFGYMHEQTVRGRKK